VEEWVKKKLLKIVEGYEPTNIYNADETGLLPCNADGADRLSLMFNCRSGNPH
jgi:hypothetical protein